MGVGAENRRARCAAAWTWMNGCLARSSGRTGGIATGPRRMRLDRLTPGEKGAKTVRVVSETSRGCRNKSSYAPEERVFLLKKTLPEGHVFPFDFGFIPRTKGEDGDP